MWYKNVAGRFLGLVTKHAFDRRTDRWTDTITTPKTALALRRAVEIGKDEYRKACWITNAGILYYCQVSK